MSTLDQKAPVPAAGTGDFLDQLVRDDLARSESLRKPGSPATPAMDLPGFPNDGPEFEKTAARQEATEVVDRQDPQPEMSDEERVKLLQREIDTLLNAPLPPSAPQPAAAPQSEPLFAEARDTNAVEHVDLPQAEHPVDTEPELGLTSALSEAEVQLLTMPISAGSTAGAALPLEAEEEQKLTEAEGVVEDELANLLAGGEGERAAVAAAASGEAPAASVQPLAEAPAPPLPPVPVSVGRVVEESFEPITPTSQFEAEAKVSALGRAGGVCSDLLLLAFQVIDAPFSWLGELDKNAIGIAALLLLLSGMALYVLTWIYR